MINDKMEMVVGHSSKKAFYPQFPDWIEMWGVGFLEGGYWSF